MSLHLLVCGMIVFEMAREKFDCDGCVWGDWNLCIFLGWNLWRRLI